VGRGPSQDIGGKTGFDHPLVALALFAHLSVPSKDALTPSKNEMCESGCIKCADNAEIGKNVGACRTAANAIASQHAQTVLVDEFSLLFGERFGSIPITMRMRTSRTVERGLQVSQSWISHIKVATFARSRHAFFPKASRGFQRIDPMPSILNRYAVVEAGQP